MAKIGEQLLQPEPGWRRYDVILNDSRYTFSNNWIGLTDTSCWNNTRVKTTVAGSSFEFSGVFSKMRLICTTWTSYSDDVKCYIDGIEYNVYNTIKNQHKTLSIEVTGLEFKKHNVKFITNKGGTDVQFSPDAIDIDEDGYLITQVGNQLIEPEPRWCRYDDTDSRITYVGSWERLNNNHYNGSAICTPNFYTGNEFAEFKFYGSRLRLISYMNTLYSTNYKIVIDDIEESFSLSLKTGFQILSYEKLNLEKKVHVVRIYPGQNGTYQRLYIDAIDIDEDGDIYHGSKYLLKNNLTNELFTIQADTLMLLDKSLSLVQIYNNNGFETVSLVCNEFSKTSTSGNVIEIDTGKCFDIPILDGINSVESVVIR